MKDGEFGLTAAAGQQADNDETMRRAAANEGGEDGKWAGRVFMAFDGLRPSESMGSVRLESDWAGLG